MSKFYRYDGKLVQLEESHVAEILGRIETSLRGGKISYVPDGLCQGQIADIKNKWPDTLRHFLKEKAIEIAGSSKPNPMDVKKAACAIIDNECRKRASQVEEHRRASALAYQFKIASSDMALSMLFSKAPSICPKFPRIFDTQLGEIPVSIQVSERPVRLVIETTVVRQSMIFLSGIYLPMERKTYITGWAGQKQVMAAPVGNNATDPDNCSWKRSAHYIEFEDLKPMAELLDKMGIKEVTERLLFETVPDKNSLPLLTNLSPIDTSKKSEEDDYGMFFKKYVKDDPPAEQVHNDTKAPKQDMSLLDF